MGTPSDEPVGSTWGTWDGPEVVIHAEDLDVFLTVEPPLELYGGYAPTFADLDGDGATDLLVVTLDRTDEANVTHQYLVRGPLEDIHLPDDAWVTLDLNDGQRWLTPFELTGDDALDLVMWGYSGPVDYHPFPYDGSLPPAGGWIELDPEIVQSWNWIDDLDGDGTADRMRSIWSDTAGESVEITWGPVDRWGAAPDVTVAPTCRDGEVNGYYFGAMQATQVPGDLDGNGSTELVTTPYGSIKSTNDCGGFTLSLPEAGTVDPFASPHSLDGLVAANLQPIGDWSGDGLSELWTAWSSTLLVSPVTLMPNGVVAAQTITTSWVIEALTPLTFDMDGDGRTEVLATLDDRVLAVLSPDLELLTDLEVETAWDAGLVWPYPYVDGGNAYIALSAGDSQTTMRRIDLGPATTP